MLPAEGKAAKVSEHLAQLDAMNSSATKIHEVIEKERVQSARRVQEKLKRRQSNLSLSQRGADQDDLRLSTAGASDRQSRNNAGLTLSLPQVQQDEVSVQSHLRSELSPIKDQDSVAENQITVDQNQMK